jgi:hypothetical protein
MDEMMRDLIDLQMHMKFHQGALDDIHQQATRGVALVSIPLMVGVQHELIISPYC